MYSTRGVTCDSVAKRRALLAAAGAGMIEGRFSFVARFDSGDRSLDRGVDSCAPCLTYIDKGYNVCATKRYDTTYTTTRLRKIVQIHDQLPHQLNVWTIVIQDVERNN